MAKVMKFDQAFFGADKDGYRVLSISNPSFSKTVESLCSAIGTPDGFSDVSPFLISYPEGAYTFMICCRLGNVDSSGRRTLFFHVLWGARSECDINGINASVLLDNNVFACKSTDKCMPLTLNCDNLKKASGIKQVFPWKGRALTILSHAPCNDLLEAEVGEKSTSIPWASFSFSELPQFKIYALSKFVLSPSDRDCCDVSGKILSTARKPDKTIDERRPRVSDSRQNHFPTVILVSLLIISVLFNCFLGYCLYNQKPREVEKIVTVEKQVPGPVQTKVEIKTVRIPGPSEDDVRSKVLAELASKFSKSAHIKSIETEMNTKILKDISSGALPKEAAVFRKLTQYVDFVNNNILNVQTRENQK